MLNLGRAPSWIRVSFSALCPEGMTIGGHGLSTGPTLGGQSGSPVLDAKGRAVALVSVGRGTSATTECERLSNAGTGRSP